MSVYLSFDQRFFFDSEVKPANYIPALITTMHSLTMRATLQFQGSPVDENDDARALADKAADLFGKKNIVEFHGSSVEYRSCVSLVFYPVRSEFSDDESFTVSLTVPSRENLDFSLNIRVWCNGLQAAADKPLPQNIKNYAQAIAQLLENVFSSIWDCFADKPLFATGSFYYDEADVRNNVVRAVLKDGKYEEAMGDLFILGNVQGKTHGISFASLLSFPLYEVQKKRSGVYIMDKPLLLQINGVNSAVQGRKCNALPELARDELCAELQKLGWVKEEKSRSDISGKSGRGMGNE